jgi:hypothetical protein
MRNSRIGMSDDTKLVSGMGSSIYNSQDTTLDSDSSNSDGSASPPRKDDNVQKREQTMIDLREEQSRLEKRIVELEEGAYKLQTDNSVMKMKTTLTLGSMKLQIDSLQEDRKFLIEKLFVTDMKLRASKKDLAIKEKELDTLKDIEKRRQKSTIEKSTDDRNET